MSHDPAGAVTAMTQFGPLFVHDQDPFITPSLLQDGIWEAGETANVSARLEAGMTFVDVGAHVGYFTVLAARIVGEQGLVFAFEPDERNFALLLANVSRHRLTNVVSFPWAVTDRTGFVELHISADNTGDHRVFAAEEARHTRRVHSIALDSLAAVLPTVDVVKLDVQGVEDAAIRGMEALLSASPNVVLSVEFWPYGLQLFGGDPRRVLDYYRNLGFAVRVQDPDQAGTRAMTDDEILEACREKDGWAFVTLLLERG